MSSLTPLFAAILPRPPIAPVRDDRLDRAEGRQRRVQEPPPGAHVVRPGRLDRDGERQPEDLDHDRAVTAVTDHRTAQRPTLDR